MPFERIVLESDPDFNVQKEYEDELVYYYQNHPEDKGYVPPKSMQDKLAGFLGGARNAIDGVVKARDELYGYDKKGGSGIHLKPVEDMEFLPGGMAGSGDDLGGFGFGGMGKNMSSNPFAFQDSMSPDHKKKEKQNEKGQTIIYQTIIKKAKKTEKKNPKKVIRIKRDKPDDSGFDVMNADPFGIRKRK
jgi:hypothetical protein